MHWVTYFLRRTLGHLRREPVLNGATVLTLAVAFLCFGAFLALALGLGSLASRWASDFHLSVYLAESVDEAEAGRIAEAFAALPQVERATVVPSAEMRERLVSTLGDDPGIGALESRLFPNTVEIRLVGGVGDPAEMGALAERLGALAVVEQVETYGDLYRRLTTVIAVARAIAVALGLIVLVATLLVVSNTVRLSMLGRREEIEIQKLCGATDRFVQAPFLITGAFQGLAGALLSLGLLALTTLLLHRAVGGFLPAWPGGGTAGLPPVLWGTVVAGGTLLGLLGSHLSVRRFLRSAP